jgi:hypothetical protein
MLKQINVTNEEANALAQTIDTISYDFEHNPSLVGIAPEAEVTLAIADSPAGLCPQGVNEASPPHFLNVP